MTIQLSPTLEKQVEREAKARGICQQVRDPLPVFTPDEYLFMLSTQSESE